MVQEAKEGGPTKALRDTAWDAGFSDATDGKPLRDWPKAETAGDYAAGHADGLDAVANAEAQEGEAEENDEADAMAYLRGAFATLGRALDEQAAEIAKRAHLTAGEAALDIAEEAGATFRALVRAIDGEDGPEAIVAVRDTMRQVDPTKAAEAIGILPPGRDATRRGLARQIGKKRAQLAYMDRGLRQYIPPAYLDNHGRDLWSVQESAKTVTQPQAAARRHVARELAALVHAWDVM